MKICTIVGARPQFIKAAPLNRALAAKSATEIIIHTGQHYDYQMSAVFFEQLGLPQPNYNLGIGSGLHGQQTGRMLEQIETVLLTEKPDWLLVYGDTNSTLAGTLAAIKLHLPVAHVEAGLRSFNRTMPEEHNRVLTDHAADLLFCPTDTAVNNLNREGITAGVHNTGDVMYDAVLFNATLAQNQSTILQKLNIARHNYYLATIHRPYNTDIPQHLGGILQAFGQLDKPVIFPAHPRTPKFIQLYALSITRNIRIIEPVDYLDMLMLEQNAYAILTDSGGVQKEAYFFARPCITIRPETEWLETVKSGWNTLADPEPASILAALSKEPPAGPPPSAFGNGNAAQLIVDHLLAGR